MNFIKFPLFAALILATALVVGCGDQKDPRLSDADIAYMKQQRLLQMYGGGTTSTNTSTVVQYVTITNTTTVNVAH